MFIKTIPYGHCLIVERAGKPVRVAQSGRRFFIPFLDKAKNVSGADLWGDETNKEGIFLELSEQQRDTDKRKCYTKDNVELTVDCVYRWRLVDPVKAVYEVDKLHKSILEAVLSEVRAFVGQKDLNTVIGSRSELSEHVVSALEKTLTRWGVKLTGLEVQELTADEATQAAMLQQLEAARRSEALKLESEGRAAAIIKQAEAEKTAMILKAEAAREAMRIVANGDETYLKSLSGVVGYKNATKLLMTVKTLESYQSISGNPANKVFMPLQTLPEVVTSENIQTKAILENK